MRHVESFQPLPSGGLLHATGSPDGPAILFLHGVGGGAWSWKPQVGELGSDFSCFVWEARGHGAAPRVADAGLADYYTDASEALAAIRARRTGGVTLAGHSMGGLLALALATREPAGVNGLVLIDAVFPETDRPSGHDLGPLAPALLLLLRPLVSSFVNDGRVARTIARWMFERSFDDKARMEAAWLDQRAQVPIEYPRMFFEAFGKLDGFPILPFAELVDVPVLSFNTRSKPFAATVRKRLGDRFWDERVAGGHYLQLDRPDAVNGRLRRFVRERIAT